MSTQIEVLKASALQPTINALTASVSTVKGQAETARDAAQTAQTGAETAETNAVTAKNASEAARDEATAQAGIATNAADASALSAALVPAVASTSATLAAALGQVDRRVEGLEVTAGDGAVTLDFVLKLAAIVGQVAAQVNGGRAEMTGGTLADPALRVGTAGIYSSAADTLSIAIAGSEVARFTASGLTIFGTITEAP